MVTGLNRGSGWQCWGDWTACYPANRDVKDYFIPLSRMFDWVGKTLINTFWHKLDKPMTRRLVDTILDSCNIWLAGLVGSGYLLGARAEMLEAENPLTSLMAGRVKMQPYRTVQGDMWDSIAYRELGSEAYTDKLMRLNQQYLEIYIFPAGIELQLPEVEQAARLAEDLPPWKR
ncbi:MAG: tail protein X [Firmicutes bacterium]|nr:tail protein X [Bacillota bacterium]